jgi:hypothetical protein
MTLTSPPTRTIKVRKAWPINIQSFVKCSDSKNSIVHPQRYNYRSFTNNLSIYMSLILQIYFDLSTIIFLLERVYITKKHFTCMCIYLSKLYTSVDIFLLDRHTNENIRVTIYIKRILVTLV